MPNLKELWYKYKIIVFPLLFSVLFWLILNIIMVFEPLVLRKPELSSWEEIEVLTSTLYVAFPSHLPYGDFDINVPFALKMEPFITNTSEISSVLVNIEVNGKPVIFLDNSGNRVSSPLSILADGKTALYNMGYPVTVDR